MNFQLLDQVVRESADPEQRAAATYLMQYGPRGPHTTEVIVNALQYALQDDDDAVRENAARALRAVAVGAKLHPEQKIKLEPTWFVELMNSVVWSDRRDASHALVNLTENRDPDALELLRERALPSVLEMARWHDLQQALPAFILAGRLAGLDETAIKTAWVNGNRETVLKEAAATVTKRSGFLHHGRVSDNLQ
jgi:HEAT repeat protein